MKSPHSINRRRVAGLMLLGLTVTLSLFGQLNAVVDGVGGRPGQIAGVLVLPGGTGPAAGVRLEILETGLATVTDDRGEYQFLPMAAGTYTIVAAGPGYSRLKVTDVGVQPGRTIMLDRLEMPVVLRDGAVQQLAEVVVQASRDPDEEEILRLAALPVTGASFRRLERERALPITAMTRDTAGLRDASTPVALLTALPQVVNVPLGETATLASAARGDNASVNLRGAGTGNTLVLFNGRRLPAHPISSIDEGAVPSLSVNVNQLPTHGFARIDVLRDGASSFYGTDAVAGVINVISDRDFRGTLVSSRLAIPEQAGGLEYGAAVQLGRESADGRARVVSVFEVLEREEILLRDRAFSRDPDKTSRAPAVWQTPGGGPFYDLPSSDDFGTFLTGERREDGVFYPGRPSGVPAPRVGSDGRFYLSPSPVGVRLQAATPSRLDADERGYYSDGVVAGFAQNATQRFNAFTLAEWELDSGVTAFAEFGWYQAGSENPAGDAPIFRAGNPAISYANLPLVVSATNPWNPFGARFFDPAGSPDAAGAARLTGEPSDVEVGYTRLHGLPGSGARVDSSVHRVLGGLRGTWAEGWNWETAALHTVAATRDRWTGLRESVLQDAVASGRLNPFGYTFAVRDGQLVVEEQHVIDAGDFPGLVDRMEREGRTALSSVDFRVIGDAGRVLGVPLTAAMGGEYRRESYRDGRPPYVGYNPPDSGLRQGANDFVGSSPAGNTRAAREMSGGFVELAAPLVRPTPGRTRLGLHALEISAGVRVEDYVDFGGATKPKFSVNWRPGPSLLLRASANEGLRAPNLAVLYSADLPRQRGIADPYRQPVTRLNTDGSYTRPFVLLANPDLRAESTRGRSIGFVFEPSRPDGFVFYADYWRIDQRDVIVSPFNSLTRDDYEALRLETSRQLAAGVAIDAVDLGSGTAAYRGAAGMMRLPVTDEDRAYFSAFNAGRPRAEQLGAVGEISHLRSQYVNRSSGTLAGLDWGASWRWSSNAWGRLQVTTDWSYTLVTRYVDDDRGPVDEAVHDNPRLRGSASLVWRRKSWSAGLSLYYTGEYLDTDAVLTPAQFESLRGESGAAPSYLRAVADQGVTSHRYIVSDVLTANVRVSRRFFGERGDWWRGLAVTLGVSNLAGVEPPLTSAVNGYEPSLTGSLVAGRTWTIEVSRSF